MSQIGPEFFTCNPVECARELVGCIFHWDGCSGRIVETEAYSSVDDEACHTWSRKVAREFVANHAPGASYVYLNYGVHWLFNFLVKGESEDGFVLVRAIEPLSGLEEMRGRRPGVSDSKLAAGPGCLTKAFGIDGGAHGGDIFGATHRGLEQGRVNALAKGPRIGISKAVDRLWRFGKGDSKSLSRRF